MLPTVQAQSPNTVPGNSPDYVLNVPFGKHTRERERKGGGERDRDRKIRGGRRRVWSRRGEWEKKKMKERREEGPVSVIMLGHHKLPKVTRSLRMVLIVFMLLASFDKNIFTLFKINNIVTYLSVL